LGGGPLHENNVRVYFQSSDASIIPTDFGTYVMTDDSGMANFTFTANKTGNVNMTIHALSLQGPSAKKTFQIIEASVAATSTPTPTPTPTAEPSPSATAEPSAVVTVTPGPITSTPTAVPSSTPSTGNSDAQVTGILAVGIVLAIGLLVVVFIARIFGKK
jgi:uncharacterized surface anchored protein